MDASARGNVAESAILNAFIERGLHVLVPFGEGQPYDLVVHLPGGRFLRVQCKTARRIKGTLGFNSRTTDHGRGRMPYEGLADVFGVFFPPTKAVYLVPVEEVSRMFVVHLRVQPTRNNQRRRVRLAADYEIDRWTVDDLQDLVGSARPVQPSKRLGRSGASRPLAA
jgi:hypothetical protein